MTQIKSYAQFNSFTVAGRVFAAELASNNGSEFLAVTLITNCVNDDNGVTVTFNNSNGMLGLYKKGWLPVGRQLTITGHIASVSSTYTKNGEVFDRKRPNIHLTGATLLDGGLGPMPADKSAGMTPANAVRKGRRPVQDQTPDLAANAAANADY